MKILSAAEMQACDRVTSEQFGVSPGQLMAAASRAVAEFARAQFPHARRITVLCGRGNNGGDGLHAACLLAKADCSVTVLLLGDPTGLKGDAAEGWRAFTANQEMSGKDGPAKVAISVTTAEELALHSPILQADLIVDAVLGTGFKPPMRDLPLAALEWLRTSGSRAPVLAVDLPSGWDADSQEAELAAAAYPADAVVTFTAPKPAHVFGLLTRNLRQPIVVAPIGSPDAAIVSELNLSWSGASKAVTDARRPADSNKGMYGHVLVVGGSVGKSGAPAMASLSALRAGAGLVTAAVSPQVLPLVASVAPELMTQALATTPGGEISPENLSAGNLKALLNRITVLALGPGLGTTPEAGEFAIGLLQKSRIAAVVDADALNALSKHIEMLPEIAAGRTVVLTPHPGEMGRLVGLKTEQVQADRIRISRDFAMRNGVTLVLKGWRTLIAHPDGTIAVNTTGNPAMAKGGSGDLLTGMVAAMLAQHPDDPQRAVEAAVYLHGLAADVTVQSAGVGGDEHTLLATDSLNLLWRAFQFHPFRLQKDGDTGYCWLQGLPAEFLAAGRP